MFQPAAVVVNAGLVQLPCICVGPKSTCGGPAEADDPAVVVDPPAPVVVVDPLEAVVVVDPPAAVVVVVDPPAAPPLDEGAVVVVDPVGDLGKV